MLGYFIGVNTSVIDLKALVIDDFSFENGNVELGGKLVSINMT